MYAGQSIAVVVTAYREAAHVGAVIESIPDFVDRIYVVDDASPDNCWSVIRRAADRINGRPRHRTDGGHGRRVVPLRHRSNRGYGAAVKTGYRQAVPDGMDVIAVMNGDGQMDPDILDRIVDPVARGSVAYAKGNRLLRSSDRSEMGLFRFVGNVTLSLLTKFAAGYWRLSDPQNGYTAISSRALRDLDLTAITDEYGFLNDLLVQLNVRNYRVADVAMTATYGDEQSSIRYVRFVRRVSWLLLRGFLWRLKVNGVRAFTPAVGYYLVALIAGLVTLGHAVGRFVFSRGTVRGMTCPGILSLFALAQAIERDADESAPLEVTRFDQPEHSDGEPAPPPIEIDS